MQSLAVRPRPAVQARQLDLPARLVLLATLFLGAGCTSVRFAADYDEILDAEVTALHARTTAFLSKLETGNDADYQQNRGFYEEARGVVASLTQRARVHEEGLERTPLTKNFEDLQVQYDEMEQAHRAGMFATPEVVASTRKAMDMALSAITKHIMFLKWKSDPGR